jgi:trimeric autotransporter adhesin
MRLHSCLRFPLGFSVPVRFLLGLRADNCSEMPAAQSNASSSDRFMRPFPAHLTLLLVAAALGCAPAIAQQANAPRIVNPIDESVLTTLHGGVPGRARAEFDQGSAPAGATISSARLVLSRTPQQEAALEQFMAGQLNPASPNYHNWLTPAQFGSLYGPADSDINTLVDWLASHGLTVQQVAPGHTSIAFSGTVAQLESAFHTEIHSFNAGGEEFIANTTDPSIPSALATVVSGIAQLDTIRPRPHNVPGPLGKYDPQLKRLTRANSGSAAPAPMLTLGSTGDYFLYITAGDAATIYDTPDKFNANFSSSGTSYTGSGVTIGIGGDATIQGSTVADYRNMFLGDTTQPTIINDATTPATCTDASSTSCNQDEAYLDTETSGGVAPGANIVFYTSANLSDAIEDAISDNTVDIFSLSFGSCEAGMSTADNQLINSWWQQAASQGIAVTVSSGDSGSAGCDNDDTEEVAQYGQQVSGFASTPYNIAVGGTDFAGLTTNFTNYVGTTNSASNYYSTALSYIPESTWNDSTNPNTTISANVPYVSSGETNIIAGSGGASSCSTNTNTGTTLTNCTSGYAKPSWQTGAGVPADGVRDVPDVSLMAGNGLDSASWLVCTDDTGTVNGTTVTTDCTTQSNGELYFSGFGGTSASAPAFAGILALVEQKAGSRLGLAAQELYSLYNGSHASTIFHDITAGDNSVPCTQGTPNCSENTAGNYFLTGYNTGTGYDLATGLGSVDATQLVTYWGASSETSTPALTVTPASTSITTAQSLSVPVSISGSGATPTGTVTLTSGSYSSGAEALTSGAYTFTIPAGSLAVGSDTLTISYSGDSNYSSGSATVSVAVSAATPTVTAWPTASAITYGQTLASSTLNGGTASVAGSFAWATSTTAPVAGSQSESVTFTPTNTTDYDTVTGDVTVTVNKATPTVTAWPTASSIVAGQTLSSSTLTGGTASVAGSFAWTAPTTAPSAGSLSESVTFTPTDITDYNPVTGTVTVTVSPQGHQPPHRRRRASHPPHRTPDQPAQRGQLTMQ